MLRPMCTSDNLPMKLCHQKLLRLNPKSSISCGMTIKMLVSPTPPHLGSRFGHVTKKVSQIMGDGVTQKTLQCGRATVRVQQLNRHLTVEDGLELPVYSRQYRYFFWGYALRRHRRARFKTPMMGFGFLRRMQELGLRNYIGEWHRDLDSLWGDMAGLCIVSVCLKQKLQDCQGYLIKQLCLSCSCSDKACPPVVYPKDPEFQIC